MSNAAVRPLDLLSVVDRFLEAVKRVDKWRAIEGEAARLEKVMSKAFAVQAGVVAKTFDVSYRSYFQEADLPFDDDPIFTSAERASIEGMRAGLEDAASGMLENGGKALIAELELEASFDLKNPRAVKYLQEHGADLVKKLNETTRDDMRHVLAYARENGWSYDKTAAAIQERYKGYYDPGSWWNFDAPRPQGHIDTRAHLIAVTESGNAYEAGSWLTAQQLMDGGLLMEKRWTVAADERDCEICDGNAAEDWIPAGDEFSSGDLYPLAHPGCRCDAQYRKAEDDKPDFIRVPNFQSVGDAEDWASKVLGIAANYADNAVIADLVTNALAQVGEKGFEIPDVVVDEEIFTEYNEPDAPCLHYKGKVYINPKSEYWQDAENETKESYDIGWWSTPNKYHPIWHESGHFVHWKQLSQGVYNKLTSFAIQKHKGIAMNVSEYASMGPQEFIAEVFAGLMSGKEYSKEIIDLYIQYGGVIIK